MKNILIVGLICLSLIGCGEEYHPINSTDPFESCYNRFPDWMGREVMEYDMNCVFRTKQILFEKTIKQLDKQFDELHEQAATSSMQIQIDKATIDQQKKIIDFLNEQKDSKK